MKFRVLLPFLGLLLLLGAPLVAQQPNTLKYGIPAPPVGLQSTALLGYSVAVEGGYTVVGVPFDDLGGTDSGVVKVFNSTTGELLYVIPNPTPAVEDQFGQAVAISGTRVVVGAWRDNTGAPDAGCVYVFDLASATPTMPVLTLANPGPATSDYYGISVAISGARVVVGVWRDDVAATDAGCAYVFDLNSVTPTVPTQTLYKPSAVANDWFGFAVAIDGTRVVIGAYGDDTGATDAGSVYVYNLAGPTPTVPVQTLRHPAPVSGDYFGYAVAVSGTRVVVGAIFGDTGAVNGGSVYVYDLAGATPTTPVASLSKPSPLPSDWFGAVVAISGTRVVAGAPYDDTGGFNVGGAYVYDMTSGTPSQPVAALNNPTPGTSDWFGSGVAISGTRVVVGAPYDDTAAPDAGSAYIYELAGVTPTVPARVLNNPGPAIGDSFGSSVAVSGTRVVVGAPLDDTGAADSGSAVVYDLSSATPTVPVFTLNNPSPAVDDRFGSAVAISGTRVVVGCYLDDTGASNAGSVYVYDLTGATPTVPVQTLNNPSPAADDRFGYAVAISGTRVVVGAYLDDAGATDSGSAYVYDLSSGTPTVPVQTLINPGPAVGDSFGIAVAISGTRVVVGAHLDDTGASDAGSAYVYDLIGPTPATPTVTLNNPAPAAADNFGIAVAISGTRIVVGAHLDDAGAVDSGSAYVYDVSGGSPATPVAILTNPGPAVGDNFGLSVAISGSRVVVGAPQDDTGATDSGSAYVYDLSSGSPTVPVATLNNPGPAASDGFGFAVAIDGTTVAIGTPGDDSVMLDKGFAYVFTPETNPPAGGTMTLSPSSPVNASAALTVSFANWTDASQPLSYTVLIDDAVVSAAGPTASRNVTAPSAAGAHTLKGRVADAVGNVTEVTQAFTVLTAQESWRAQYFGVTTNTGIAADGFDADGDGHSNLFEFIAGLVPNNAASRFQFRVEPVLGQPGQKAIIFSPRLADRSYVVKSKASLTDTTWTALGSSTTSDNGTERTVIDLGAGSGARFYQVEITKP